MSGGSWTTLVVTVLIVIVLLVTAVLVSRHTGGDGTGTSAPALVVGDSVVALAARAAGGGAAGGGAAGAPAGISVTDGVRARSSGMAGTVRLIGYPGLSPEVFDGTSSPLLASDLRSAGRPRTVVLNWNGNNPRQLLGTSLIVDYRTELTSQIRWYLGHGVTRVVLAAALPSLVNNADRQVDVSSPASAQPGAMLGSGRLNEMYRQLAGAFGGRSVRYSEQAARAIHPSLGFNTTLDGRPCVIDFIHPTPYCATRYARALAALAHGPDGT
ncbi:hypothetical protein MXD59_05110 [Frankia sp. Ag45/Mut15]|uniref:SGNH hydrolase-type esterase domain-containing protein n=1 Tax=Frankia umida TaxID=573489 RepID=A0ABT0JUD9_9ACTN|nr:hypothetical protein [Frankia umida]MCK9875167.1 hypothetical protein [Frankia umida]